MDELQRRYLQLYLEETGWNRRRAAAVLDLDRRTIQRLIARYQLQGAVDPEAKPKWNGTKEKPREESRGSGPACPHVVRTVPGCRRARWGAAFCACAPKTARSWRARPGLPGRQCCQRGQRAAALTAGYILNPGDRVDTRGGGRVVIDLSDGSMVVVQPEIGGRAQGLPRASSLRELFEITLGMVRVKINHFAGKPNPYRMNSPTASIAVRGTEFSIAVAAGGTRRWRSSKGWWK